MAMVTDISEKGLETLIMRHMTSTDVLRKGVDHGPLHFNLFYGTPSSGNAKVMALNKIGGKARTMVVCNGIEHAVQYSDLTPLPGSGSCFLRLAGHRRLLNGTSPNQDCGQTQLPRLQVVSVRWARR
jgi:hypothetical protein